MEIGAGSLHRSMAERLRDEMYGCATFERVTGVCVAEPMGTETDESCALTCRPDDPPHLWSAKKEDRESMAKILPSRSH